MTPSDEQQPEFFVDRRQGPSLSGHEAAAMALDRGSPGDVGAGPSFA
jgi:hypothetical protein